VIDKIKKYLNSRPKEELSFRKEDTSTLKIDTNADYAYFIIDRKYIFEYGMFLGGSLVAWRSKN